MSRMFNATDYDSRPVQRDIIPGEYKVMAVDDRDTGGVNRKRSANGKEYLEVTFKVLSPVEFQGKLIWDRFFLTDAALFRLGSFHRATDPDDAVRPSFDLDDDNGIHAALYYKPVLVKVAMGAPYGDKPAKPEISSYYALTGTEYDAAMDIAEKCLTGEHAQQWGGGPRHQDAYDVQPKRNQTKGNYNPPNDDDLPF